MSDTNFTDEQTIIYAEWLNEVNTLVHTILGGPATLSDLQDALQLERLPFVTKTGDYTLALSDAGTKVRFTSGTTVSVDDEANVTFTAGQAVTIANYTGSDMTIAALNAATFNGNTTLADGSTAVLHYIGSDVWDIA